MMTIIGNFVKVKFHLTHAIRQIEMFKHNMSYFDIQLCSELIYYISTLKMIRDELYDYNDNEDVDYIGKLDIVDALNIINKDFSNFIIVVHKETNFKGSKLKSLIAAQNYIVNALEEML